jgi:hypothetical protein
VPASEDVLPIFIFGLNGTVAFSVLVNPLWFMGVCAWWARLVARVDADDLVSGVAIKWFRPVLYASFNRNGLRGAHPDQVKAISGQLWAMRLFGLFGTAISGVAAFGWFTG